MNLDIKNKTDYLLVGISGKFNLREMQSFFNEIKSQLVGQKLNKILADISGMDMSEMSDFERFAISEGLTKAFDINYKFAVVMKKEMYHGFGENVILNRGVNMKIFFSIDEAKEWI